MFLAQKGIIPPKEYQHDVELKDKYGCTVCYYLWDNGIMVPENWQDEQYKYPERAKGDRPDRTLAMQQIVDKKEIPDKKYYHDPTITNDYGSTVAITLATEGIIPPKQWYYEPELQNKNQHTVAMLLAYKGKIPPEKWEHRPDLQDNNGNTVAMILANQRIIPLKQWEHDPTIQNFSGWTVAMILALNKIIPSKQWRHDPELTNNDNCTVAMLLVNEKINPPTYWNHNPNITENVDNMTVAMYLANNGMGIQECWNHKPELQSKYGDTVAMYLANKGIIPSNQWNHNPSLQDKDGDTVAMLLSKNKIIPSSQWEHQPELRNNKGNTVAVILAQNGIVPPKHWNHDPNIQFENGWTVAMWLASNGNIPPQQWYHNPFLQQKQGITVAMWLAYNKIIPPSEWEHYPYMRCQGVNNMTVSMILVCNDIIPPRQWDHDPNIKDDNGKTVEDHFRESNLFIPKQWRCDKQPQMKPLKQNQLILKLQRIIIKYYQFMRKTELFFQNNNKIYNFLKIFLISLIAFFTGKILYQFKQLFVLFKIQHFSFLIFYTVQMTQKLKTQLNQVWTLIFENNALIDKGISIISRQTQQSRSDISFRDLNMLFTNTNGIEPRKDCIILTLSTTDCLILPNQLHFIIRQDTFKLVNFLIKNFSNYNDTPDFELTSLELILDFIIEEFNQQFEESRQNIDKLEKQLSPKQTQLFEEKLKITALYNDIVVTSEALDNLLDDDDDVLALSFKNQKLMKNFVCRSKRTQQSITVSKQQSKTQISNQQEQSNSILSVYDYDEQPIKYVYEVPTLSLFLQRNLYQLHSTQIASQTYCDKVQSLIEVQQIKINSIRNRLLQIQAYSEVVCTAICIMNTIAVVFGSNLNNPWYPEDGDTNDTVFWIITSLIFLTGIIYTIVSCLIFYFNYKKFI